MYHSKYVTGEVLNGNVGVLVAIVFPRYISHDAVKSVFIPGTIRSAGMFEFTHGRGVTAFGESKSLNVGYMIGDETLIRRAIDPGNFPMEKG